MRTPFLQTCFMNWQEYKEHMQDEWRFLLRHPEMLVVIAVYIGIAIWAIVRELEKK